MLAVKMSNAYVHQIGCRKQSVMQTIEHWSDDGDLAFKLANCLFICLFFALHVMYFVFILFIVLSCYTSCVFSNSAFWAANMLQ